VGQRRSPWSVVAPVVVSVAVVAGALVWIAVSDPPTGGHTCSPVGDVRAPVVSEPSGFRDDGFELTITPRAGSGPLYVTLDGSYPDPERNPEATFVYEAPIEVRDRRGEPLVLASIRTQIDPEALAEGREGAPTWDVAEADIDRATVVRARQKGAGECVAVYFVGPGLRRDDLAVAHLSTDPDHLFGAERGIYVPGQIFTDYINGPSFDPDNLGWPFLPANYGQRGRDWERPAIDDLERSIVLHWFEPGGELSYVTNVGLRTHGGATRSLAMKSLRLYARTDYGNRSFGYPFFGDAAPDTHRRLLLRNAGNDCVCANPIEASPRTHMADDFLQSLVHDLRFETQASRPVALFIDGEYWGLQWLKERYDEDYLATHHGVDPSEAVIVDNFLTVQVGLPDDARPLVELLDLLAASDPADPATLQAVEAQLDVDSFIDWVSVEIFVSNGDWPENNTEFWRTRQPTASSTGQGDGRWRMLLYDLDAVGNWSYNADHNMFAELADVTPDQRYQRPERFLFTSLMAIDSVKQRFVDRLGELLDTTFDPTRTVAELDRWTALLAPEMDDQRARWYAGVSDEDWNAHFDVAPLRRFLAERPAALRQQLATFAAG
jgi:hypothetical protein